MTVNYERLRNVDTFWYLASPYTKYEAGVEEAFSQVAMAAGELMKHKVPVFCPITHSHPIAMNADLPLNDHDFWLNADWPIFDCASGVIILEMKGWEDSFGVQEEIKRAVRMDKTLEFMPWDD